MEYSQESRPAGLIGIWGILSAVTLAVMLTHRSDHPVFFGRYSPKVFGSMVALAVFAVAGVVGYLVLRRRPEVVEGFEGVMERRVRRDWLYPTVLVGIAVVTGLVWWFVLGDHLPQYAMLRSYLVAVIVVVAYILVGERRQGHRVWVGLCVAAIVVGLIVGLFTRTMYPPTRVVDEGWNLNVARTIAVTGEIGLLMYRHAGLEHFPFPMSYYPASWVMQAIGFGLYQGRLAFLLMGLVSLPFLWGATRRLFDEQVAWIATEVALFGYLSVNYIRSDVFVALALSIALYFHALGKEGKAWVYPIVGFAAVMAVEGHPAAYCLAMGFGVLYLVEAIGRLRTSGKLDELWRFGGFAFGGAVGMVAYYLLRTALSGSDPMAEVTGRYLDRYITYVFSHDVLTAAGILVTGLAEKALTSGGIIAFSFALGIGLLVWRVVVNRSDEERDILIITLVSVLTFVLTYSHVRVYYLNFWVPLMAMVVGYGMSRGWGLYESPGTLSVFGAMAVFTVLVVGVVLGASGNQGVLDVVEAGRQIEAILPDDAVIVGEEAFYLGMPYHDNFVGYSSMEHLAATFGVVDDPGDIWEIVEPDAVIIMPGWMPISEALTDYIERENFVLLRCYPLKSYETASLWVREVPEGIEPDTTDCPDRLW